MTTHLLSTRSLAPAARLAYWRGAVCETYVQLACDCPGGTDFDGEIRLHSLPDTDISVVRSTPQTVYRQPRFIATDSRGYFLLSLQLRGHGRVQQQGREAILEPGEASLYSSTEPYQLDFQEPFSQLVIRLPQQPVLAHLPGANDLTARRLPRSAGLTALAALAQGVLGGKTEADPFHTAQAVSWLLLADLAPLARRQAPGPVMASYWRIRRCLEKHAPDPDFDRQVLAAELNMSVRRINEILALRGGSIQRDLRNIRLAGAHADLRQTGERGKRVCDVAWDWGFRDVSAFARAYRREYGHSPSATAKPSGNPPALA